MSEVMCVEGSPGGSRLKGGKCQQAARRTRRCATMRDMEKAIQLHEEALLTRPQTLGEVVDLKRAIYLGE